MDYMDPIVSNKIKSSEAVKDAIEQILQFCGSEGNIDKSEKSRLNNILNNALKNGNASECDIVNYINTEIANRTFSSRNFNRFSQMNQIAEKTQALFPILDTQLRKYLESPAVCELMGPLNIQELINKRGGAWAQKVKAQLNRIGLERLTQENILAFVFQSPLNLELIQLLCFACVSNLSSPAKKALKENSDLIIDDLIIELQKEGNTDINVVNSLLEALEAGGSSQKLISSMLMRISTSLDEIDEDIKSGGRVDIAKAKMEKNKETLNFILNTSKYDIDKALRSFIGNLNIRAENIKKIIQLLFELSANVGSLDQACINKAFEACIDRALKNAGTLTPVEHKGMVEIVEFLLGKVEKNIVADTLQNMADRLSAGNRRDVGGDFFQILYLVSPAVRELMGPLEPLDIQELINKRGGAWAQKVKAQLNRIGLEHLTQENILELVFFRSPLNLELIQLLCAANPGSPAKKALKENSDHIIDDLIIELQKESNADINVVNSLLEALEAGGSSQKLISSMLMRISTSLDEIDKIDKAIKSGGHKSDDRVDIAKAKMEKNKEILNFILNTRNYDIGKALSSFISHEIDIRAEHIKKIIQLLFEVSANVGGLDQACINKAFEACIDRALKNAGTLTDVERKGMVEIVEFLLGKVERNIVADTWQNMADRLSAGNRGDVGGDFFQILSKKLTELE